MKFGLILRSSRHLIRNASSDIKYFSSKMSESLDKVADVEIDPSGTFKYILITVTDSSNKSSKQIVRGNAACGYHADIFDLTEEQLKKISSALRCKCTGGGRIKHEPSQKTIKVYGYSQGFGKADHEVSVELLKKKYPDYDFTWSDEGY